MSRFVRYIGADDAQVKWGMCDDPRPLLTEGNVYEVEEWEEHSWHTKVFLVGVDSDRGFNSVCFKEVADVPHD